MFQFETIETETIVTACNGGGGAMGHPRVYLNLAPSGRIECPYCSRTFINRRLAINDAEGGATLPAPGHG